MTQLSSVCADGQDYAIIVIPAHNEEKTIRTVIQGIKSLQPNEKVVVVDDASTDTTASTAQAAGATVLSLALRLGAWGAIQTGIRYALDKGCQTVITMDADGQHEPAYVDALLQPIIVGQADVVIGACPDRVSRARRWAWSYFRLLTGLKLEDILGFRIYNLAAIKILASAEASLIDYQRRRGVVDFAPQGLRTVEVQVPMGVRTAGISRVFSSWWVVANYMLQTSLLCIARVRVR
ncbi:MAG: glycosyltransferase family 2 protein [Candidatus Competibacteraceae bacterium]